MTGLRPCCSALEGSSPQGHFHRYHQVFQIALKIEDYPRSGNFTNEGQTCDEKTWLWADRPDASEPHWHIYTVNRIKLRLLTVYWYDMSRTWRKRRWMSWPCGTSLLCKKSKLRCMLSCLVQPSQHILADLGCMFSLQLAFAFHGMGPRLLSVHQWYLQVPAIQNDWASPMYDQVDAKSPGRNHKHNQNKQLSQISTTTISAQLVIWEQPRIKIAYSVDKLAFRLLS